jgi:hypothetical protein
MFIAIVGQSRKSVTEHLDMEIDTAGDQIGEPQNVMYKRAQNLVIKLNYLII